MAEKNHEIVAAILAAGIVASGKEAVSEQKCLSAESTSRSVLG